MNSIAVIDESVVTTTNGVVYVTGSAVIIDPDTQSAAEQAAVDAWRSGSPDRKKPFHWTDEGKTLRTAMIQAINASHASCTAVIAQCDNLDQEVVRHEQLLALFDDFSQQDLSIALVLFESREKAKANIGQNRTDHRAITQLRQSKLIETQLRYDWVDKNDPLCWFADAVAGAVSLHARGDDFFTNQIDNLTLID